MNIPQPLADSVGRPTPLDLPLPAAGGPARSERGPEPFESLLRPPPPGTPPPQPSQLRSPQPQSAEPPQPAHQPAETAESEPNADDLEEEARAGDCSDCASPEADAAAATAEQSADKDEEAADAEESDEVALAADTAGALAALVELTTPALPVQTEAQIEQPSRFPPKAKHRHADPEQAVTQASLEATIPTLGARPAAKVVGKKVEPVADSPLANQSDSKAPQLIEPVAEVPQTTDSEQVTHQPLESHSPALAAIDLPQPVIAPVPAAAALISAEQEPAGAPSGEPQPVVAVENQTQPGSHDSGPLAIAGIQPDAAPFAPSRAVEASGGEPLLPLRPVIDQSTQDESALEIKPEAFAAEQTEAAPADAAAPANSPAHSAADASLTPPSAPPAARLPAEVLAAGPGVRGLETATGQVDSARLLQRVARAFAATQNGDGEVRLRLSPPELGAVRLEIRVQDGAVIARMQTETSTARTAILDNLPALRERLAEQGVRIDRFDVELMQRHSGGPADQSGNRQPQDWAPVPRPGPAEIRRPQPAEGVVARRLSAADADSRRLNVIV